MSATAHDVIRLDDKTILLDGQRYIRSWKGTKPTKERTKEEKIAYMKAYRLSKKHQLSSLQRDNIELENQIMMLLNKS
jgi:hypothetical protein